MVSKAGPAQKALLRVHFEPDDIDIYAPIGASVAELAQNAGCPVESPCGGMGTCGKCKVKISTGAAPPSASEKRLLSETEIADGARLACRSHIVANTTVRIPDESRSLV